MFDTCRIIKRQRIIKKMKQFGYTYYKDERFFIKGGQRIPSKKIFRMRYKYICNTLNSRGKLNTDN